VSQLPIELLDGSQRPGLRKILSMLAGRRRMLVGAASVCALLVIWVFVTAVLHIVPGERFPSPDDVFGAARHIAVDGYAGGTLAVQALYSLRLVGLGFLVAAVTGVPLGLAMGLSRRFEAFVNPVFLLIRPIPPLAWIPLAIVWLGLGDGAKILVIWFAAFVPSLINTYTGVRGIDGGLIEAGLVHGASRRQIVREVIVPGAMPMIFTGLRLSLQASWTTLVAAELVGAFFGLGRVLGTAYRDFYPAMIVVAMATIAILGALTAFALGFIEHRVLRWQAR
jgi:taurine transport system permease protein